jgi:cytochrome c2
MEKTVVLVGITLLFLISAPVYAATYIMGSEKAPVQMPDENATYVGAETCKMCHQQEYEDWATTGHAYKLMTPNEAIKLRSDMPLPEGYSWGDVLYVIGGWGWKSLYIDRDGFIITKKKDGTPLEKNQYNWQDGSWSSYRSGEEVEYDCTKCHNTGSTYDRDHLNLSGVEGDWVFRGIQCEACHGPGSRHIELSGGRGVAINVNKTVEFCRQCHVVDTNASVIHAKDGFIEPYQQYAELENGGKPFLVCTSCHNPHKPVHNGVTNPEGKPGIDRTCVFRCHQDESWECEGSTMKTAKEDFDCADCHMPKVTKVAVQVGEYEADAATHIFKINTDVDAEMFSEDGKTANGYLTLDYVCLRCHEDKDKAWAASHAEGVHMLGKEIEDEHGGGHGESGKGACGPTALLLLAMLPGALYKLKRR